MLRNRQRTGKETIRSPFGLKDAGDEPRLGGLVGTAVFNGFPHDPECRSPAREALDLDPGPDRRPGAEIPGGFRIRRRFQLN
ncbi:MAG: hypothetical protein M0006_15280 [Magnetospirillum sp.]|nr:hypothetical protein [Magnetospirillum sp.]